MPRERQRSLSLVLFLLWAAFIVYGTTIPFNFSFDAATIAKHWAQANKTVWIQSGGGLPSLTDALINVLIFLPFGFLLAMTLRRTTATREPRFGIVSTMAICTVLAAIFSAFSETLQLLSPSRVTSATDLFNNTLGGWLGSVAGCVAAGPLRRWAEPRLHRQVMARPLWLAAFATAAGVMVWAVSPFDLSVDLHSLKRSVKTARLIPFGNGFRSQIPPVRVMDLLPLVIAWVPIGVAIGLATGRSAPLKDLSTQGPLPSQRPTASALMLGAGLVVSLAVGVEAAQLVIGSRHVDATDALAYASGGSLGVVLAVSCALSLRAWALLGAVCVLTANVAGGLSPWRFAWPSSEAFSLRGLVPFYHYFRRTDITAIQDAMGEVLGYLPLGLLLLIRSPRIKPMATVAIAMATAAFIEATQYLLPERTTASTDVLLAGFGAWLGWRLWHEAIAMLHAPPPAADAEPTLDDKPIIDANPEAATDDDAALDREPLAR